MSIQEIEDGMLLLATPYVPLGEHPLALEELAILRVGGWEKG
jgi:hypothetical protein